MGYLIYSVVLARGGGGDGWRTFTPNARNPPPPPPPSVSHRFVSAFDRCPSCNATKHIYIYITAAGADVVWLVCCRRRRRRHRCRHRIYFYTAAIYNNDNNNNNIHDRLRVLLRPVSAFVAFVFGPDTRTRHVFSECPLPPQAVWHHVLMCAILLRRNIT
jgi:hypothetical protein